jgi:hypothetical protein
MRRIDMEQSIIKSLALTSLFALAAFAATPVLAQHRCDQPKGIADQRACAKAAEGPAALRRFITRTRLIWDLYYPDYAPGNRAAKTSDATRRESRAVTAASLAVPD